MRCRPSATATLVLLSFGVFSAARVGAQDRDHGAKHEPDTHAHAGAAKLANPAKMTPQSVAAGEKVFQAQCASCHGSGGLGDGKDGAKLNPKPPNLTDATWKHGPSDGEIFVVIRDGAKVNGRPAMPSFASKLTASDMWNTVNYIRSLVKK